MPDTLFDKPPDPHEDDTLVIGPNLSVGQWLTVFDALTNYEGQHQRAAQQLLIALRRHMKDFKKTNVFTNLENGGQET